MQNIFHKAIKAFKFALYAFLFLFTEDPYVEALFWLQ